MKVSKLIHDLHEKVEKLEEDNNLLKETCKRVKKDNIDLRRNQDQDELNRSITNLRIENDAFITEGVTLRNENEGYLEEIKKLKKENVRLVAQLENDEHNVGHLDEKMKRLDYLEKVFASNRYVFTDIPNTPENLKMVKMMKKYVNKRRYNLRWRGQYLVDGENWKQYQYGQPLSKSKCIRVYIDSLTHAIDTVEGFNEEEVDIILGGLYKEEDQSEEFITSFEVKGEKNAEIDEEKRILNVTKQLINYFKSMQLHLQNSASKPIKDLVNVVIPKGDKKCHTQ